MPLPNRVTPFGEFLALAARGLFMGNRGGRIHGPDKTLGARRHASRAWICCQLHFKGRHRQVWGDGYTELFFLDEPTALTAGHRPCFECRRHAALAFADAWARAAGLGERPRAADMDKVLHGERLAGRATRLHPSPSGPLPDGSMVTLRSEPGHAYAMRGNDLWRWTPEGYADARPRARAALAGVLTPPSIIAVLAAGYAPHWHDSAGPQ